MLTNIEAKLTHTNVTPAKHNKDGSLRHVKYCTVTLNIFADSEKNKEAINELISSMTDEDVKVSIIITNPSLFDSAHLNQIKAEG